MKSFSWVSFLGVGAVDSKRYMDLSCHDCDVDVKGVSGKNPIRRLLFQLVGSARLAVVRWADCGQLQYSVPCIVQIQKKIQENTI